MKILVAHDGSAHADKGIQEASRMDEKLNAKLVIMTVVSDIDLCLAEAIAGECKRMTESLITETGTSIKKVADELAAKGVKAEIVIKNGNPAEMIIDTVKENGAISLLSVRMAGRALKGFSPVAYQRKLQRMLLVMCLS